MRFLRLLLFALIPSALKVRLLKLCGHIIAEGVYIGCSFLDVKHLSLGKGAYIGHGNVFKGMTVVSLGAYSKIGKFNLFTSSLHYVNIYPHDAGRLIVGSHSAITMRHYFDVQHTISIGDHSLIAGLGTIFFTHQKGFKALDEARPITIGNRVYVGTSARIMPGATIGSNIIVGGGTLVRGRMDEPFSLYANNAGTVIRRLDPNAPYFSHDDPAG